MKSLDIASNGGTLKDFLLAEAQEYPLFLRDGEDESSVKEREKATMAIYDDSSRKAWEEELVRVQNLTQEECEARSIAEYESAKILHEEDISSYQSAILNLQNMLNQINQWVPPSGGHLLFLNAAREKLQEGIAKYTDRVINLQRSSDNLRPLPWGQWLAEKVSHLQSNVTWYTTRVNRVEDRQLREKQEWTRLLKESLQ